MIDLLPDFNDEPPQDPCLLLTLVATLLLIGWLGVMQ